MITHMSGNSTPTQGRPKREYLQYQSTPDGDVRVIVESPHEKGVPEAIPKLNDSSEHSTSTGTASNKSSSSAKVPGHHTRNLSAHFFDATNLSDDPPGGDFPVQKASADDELQVSSSSDSGEGSDVVQDSSSRPYPPPQASPTVGQKHRRVFSGGVTNPVVAHRRINSGGNTAVISRGGKSGYRTSPRMSPTSSFHMSPTLSSSSHNRYVGAGHRREDSAGLDMLSAAANVSKQELAEAAGAPPPPPPPPPGRRSPPSSSGRSRPPQYNMSPTSFSSLGSSSPSQYAYHGRGGHPPHPDPKHYHQPHHHYYHPPPPPSYYPAPRGYPMQYAPPRGHPHPGHHHPGSHSGSRRPSPPPHSSSDTSMYPPPPPRRHSSGTLTGEKIDTEGNVYTGTYDEQMPPPARAGTTTGSQTFVTAISVGESNRAMRPTSTEMAPGAHHRKMSSFTSSLGAFIDELSPGNGAAAGQEVPVRSREESAPSFMQTLDDGDRLLQQLSTPVPAPAPSVPVPYQQVTSAGPPPSLPGPAVARHPDGPVASSNVDTSSKGSSSSGGGRTTTRRYMSGGTSKRVRRKCTVADCTNRVVQGGLCIAHGAKRKQCSHPGCTKNVKKAGLCSTHGPARKKCEYEGCTKVAVQGGRCISHGAKKKLCAIDSCSKQAILSGMCKKHHDENKGKAPVRGGGRRNSGGKKSTGSTKQKASIAPDGQLCVVIGEQSKSTAAELHEQQQQQQRGSARGHQRGLSIFTDMSAVDTIIGAGEGLTASDDALRGDVDAGSPGNGREVRVGIPSYDEIVQPRQGVQKPTHQRGLSIFTEESVAETIIQNPDITDTSF